MLKNAYLLLNEIVKKKTVTQWDRSVYTYVFNLLVLWNLMLEFVFTW